MNLSHPTMAIIDGVILDGPSTSVIELQCRWALQVFQRKSRLPSYKITKKAQTEWRRFFRNTCGGRTRVSHYDEKLVSYLFSSVFFHNNLFIIHNNLQYSSIYL